MGDSRPRPRRSCTAAAGGWRSPSARSSRRWHAARCGHAPRRTRNWNWTGAWRACGCWRCLARGRSPARATPPGGSPSPSRSPRCVRRDRRASRSIDSGNACAAHCRTPTDASGRRRPTAGPTRNAQHPRPASHASPSPRQCKSSRHDHFAHSNTPRSSRRWVASFIGPARG